MVPEPNIAFFTNSATAAGALIGLLFVAISLRTDSIFGDKATSTNGRALAGSSFISLVNAFFVSLTSTIPHISVGTVVVAMAMISLYSTGKMHRHLWRREPQIVVLCLSTLAYTAQLGVGVWLVLRPHQASLYDTLGYLIISSFAAALLRAWALVQGDRLAPSVQPAGSAPSPNEQ